MGWKDTITDNPKPDNSISSGSWRDTIQSDPADDPNKSAVTALTTGMIQGAVPFASAIAGAGKAGMDAITGVRGPLAGGSFGDILDDYRESRDSVSNDAKAAQKEHPKTSFAGNIIGGFENPLFKNAVAPTIIGPKTQYAGLKDLGGVMGANAIQGLGMSDADLTKGEISDAAKDVAIATGAGALGYGAGQALGAVAPYGKKLVKKALTTLGPSEEAIDARLAGMAQPDAKSYPELAEDMGGSLKGLKEQIGSAAKEAGGTLSSEPAIPKPYILSPIDDAISELGVQGKLVGPTDKNISGALGTLKEDVQNLGDHISEKDLKTLVQKMDDNINWDDQSQDKLNRTLEGLRSKFDGILKFQNPQYKEAMEPVSDRMAVMNNIKRLFNFKNVPGEGLQPTDTTATKIQTALRDNKAVTQDSLGDLSQYVGKNYQDLAKDYQLAQQFQNTGPNGARRAAIGLGLGGLIGHGSPAAIGVGGFLGGLADKYGGQAAGKLIDGYLASGNSKVFGKFAPVLQQAAQRGPQALAVTTSMLVTNPEFKNILSTLQK